MKFDRNADRRAAVTRYFCLFLRRTIILCMGTQKVNVWKKKKKTPFSSGVVIKRIDGGGVSDPSWARIVKRYTYTRVVVYTRI